MMIKLILMITLISFALPTIMLSIAFCVPQTYFSLEKLSPFECGLHPISSTRLPFSLRFFLVAILFLLFDLEIALLLPLPWGNQLQNPLTTFTLTFTVLTFLTLGFIYEWIKGGLEWSD